LRVDLFDFALPAELIAQAPLPERDAARLLVVGERLADRHVRDLPALLEPDDLIVLNETRVLPTRFAARRQRGDAAVEVTLVEALGEDHWAAFAKPGRKLRPDDVLSLAPGLEASVEAKADEGLFRLRLHARDGDTRAAIRAAGSMPLPPYIKRPRGGDPADRDRYQPIFARSEGSVAAPTASLHFTERLLDALDERGIRRTFLTLHVGLGTFLPVKADDTADHRMHAETFELPAATVAAVRDTRARGGRVIAVGTTVLRVLEAQADAAGELTAGTGQTALFITPGYRFRVVDRLLTNFHLPRSTLFMLVAALAGLERMQAAYRHAIAERYRFFSYGDACLIDRLG
jgi:S-adenosylmethionine:tRNA ribosyltransferase-isomerase